MTPNTALNNTALNNINRIITHPGGAHRDDFMAACIALAHAPDDVPIFREEPTAALLDDPYCLVLDVGERHEPELLNFDHHQLARDAEPACALSMLVDFLGLTAAFETLAPYKTTIVMDSKGPMAVAKSLGLEKLPPELLSPIEGALLDVFGEFIVVPRWLRTAMRVLGERHIKFATDKLAQLQWLRTNVQLINVDHPNGVGTVPVLAINSQNTTGLFEVRDENPMWQAAPISISRDDRGPGWALYRFDDDPRVDFSRIDGHKDVVFAHQGGFIAKTVELPLEQALILCELSLND